MHKRGWPNKTGPFGKPNENLKISINKKIFTKYEPLKVAVKVTAIEMINVWKLLPLDGGFIFVCNFSICRWGYPLLATISQLGYHEFRLGFFVLMHTLSLAEACRPDSVGSPTRKSHKRTNPVILGSLEWLRIFFWHGYQTNLAQLLWLACTVRWRSIRWNQV
jgi:hypothetical protein